VGSPLHVAREDGRADEGDGRENGPRTLAVGAPARRNGTVAV
jgi:hypothetical protein